MKAKNFRIGNYIKGSQYFDTQEAKDDLGEDYSEENEWDNLRIMSIEPENPHYTFMLECMRNNTQPYADIWHRLEGVLITEKWLESFGFEKQIGGFFKDWQTGGLQIFQTGEYWFPQLYQWAEMSHEHSQCVSINRIECIHELQNIAFALTGKELELKDESFLAAL